MGRASNVQHGFNAGEFSPLLYGRQDLDKYKFALKGCFNAVALAQGAWVRRSGMAFLHQAKFHDRESRLKPFQYSVDQTYILEFCHLGIRFYTNHGILTQTAQNITGITKANPAVVTYSGSDTYANGDRIHIAGVVGMTQVNNREFIVAGVDTGANTFQLTDSGGSNVNSTAYTTYASGGTVAEIYEVVTTYTEAELPNLRITQSADTLFITHPDHAPAKLVRNSAVSWTLSNITFLDGPYDNVNTTATTLSPGAATGSGVTITASAATGINSGQGFISTDVGRLIRMQEGTTWGYARITTVGSTVSVTADIVNTMTNTNAKVNWRLGIYSDTTGFPTCSTFHEDRLWFAGAALFPQRLDGSRSGRYDDFAPSAPTDGTVTDSHAVAFTLNADDVNAIRWMSSNEKGLLTGTARSEWVVKPSQLTEATTPTNISAKAPTRYGSAEVAPVVAGKAVLFLQRAAKKLREFAYVYEIDGFKAPDLSLLAEHLPRPSIDEMAYQEQPQAIVWSARSDGVLLGTTYERDLGAVAWHKHEIGGYSDSGHTVSALVESVACVPSPTGDTDELYCVVKRYINGGVKRYIEYMSKLWEYGDEQEDAFYVDSGWTVVNSPVASTVTGLWHLEGETVGVYIDGMTHPNVTITNGTATLERTGTIVTLGYFYRSYAETMPAEGGAQDGSAQGKIKRIHTLGFWLMDTLGLKYGPDRTDEDGMTEILERQHGDDYGAATPLFTGVFRDRFEGEYDKVGEVDWQCDGPFPANVLAVMTQFETSDAS